MTHIRGPHEPLLTGSRTKQHQERHSTMTGTLLLKISVNPTQVSIEDLIRGVLGELSFINVDRLESGSQQIVVEKEVANCDELENEFAAHDWTCALLTHAIHCVAPGAVRTIGAIWLDDAKWFCAAPKAARESTP